MLFGAVVPRYDLSYEEVLGIVGRLRGFGFKSLWFTDHLQPSRARRILETWTLMSALAQAVDEVRLGTTVLCYSYRHPSLLAKMASTLDQISGGRLELGVGLGSEPQAEEHKALGIPYPTSAEKYQWFREYVDVLRLLMGEGGEVTYRGKYYTLSGAIRNTPSLQRPHPPIWLGARRRKMLKLVAEMGLGWNFYGESLEEFQDANDFFERACTDLGRDYGRMGKAVFTGLLAYISDDERRDKARYLPPAHSFDAGLRKSFTLIHGTPDEIINQLEKLESYGVNFLLLRDLDNGLSSMKIFANHVMPSYSGKP